MAERSEAAISTTAHLPSGRIAGRAVQVMVGFLALLVLPFILNRFYTVTSFLLSGTIPEQDAFDRRYVQHPILTYFHLVGGLLFVVLGPFQFVRKIRARWIGLHRLSGRVFILGALMAGASSLALAVVLPAFGGLNTLVATFFFGFAFFVCLVKAFYHIKRGEIAIHREWMIRTFALGLGVSTIRVYDILFMIFSHQTFADVFGISFWLGFGTNAIFAEIWINVTRATPREEFR